jgi:hypothetical protein
MLSRATNRAVCHNILALSARVLDGDLVIVQNGVSISAHRNHVAGGNRPYLATGSIHPFCGYVFVLIDFKLDPKSE